MISKNLYRLVGVSQIDITNIYLYRFIIIIIGIVSVWGRYNSPVIDSGVDWFIVCAERILKGGKIGLDIYEVNTPFCVFLYLPTVVIAHFLLLPISLVNYGVTSLCMLMCINLSACILKYRGYLEFGNEIKVKIFKISFFCAFSFFTSFAFSQREHFIAVFLLPYSILKFSPFGFKENSQERPRWINMLCCILVSMALLIKPPYIISIVSIYFISSYIKKSYEIYLPGVLITLCVLLCALLSTLLFFPGYFLIINDVVATYAGYKSGVLKTLISLGESVVTPFFALILLYKVFLIPLNAERNFVFGILFLCASNAIIFMIQEKGWYYQKLPISLPLWGMIIFIFFNYIGTVKNKFYSVYLLIIIFAYHLNLLYYEYSYKIYFDANKPWVDKVQSILKGNDKFLCITFDDRCAFNVSPVNGKYVSVSRYLFLWPSLGAKSLWLGGRMEEKKFIEYINKDMEYNLDDVKKNNPKIIIVQWEKSTDGRILQFANNKIFNTILVPYKLIYSVDNFIPNTATWIFERQ